MSIDSTSTTKVVVHELSCQFRDGVGLCLGDGRRLRVNFSGRLTAKTDERYSAERQASQN